jgi:hypothetical protein
MFDRSLSERTGYSNGATCALRSASRFHPPGSTAHSRCLAWAALVAVLALALPTGAAIRPQEAPEGAAPASTGSPAAGADEVPTLIYTRTMVGSTPEYVALTIRKDGSGTYEGRRLSDPPNPRPLQLSQPTVSRLFELANQLNDFRSLSLENHRAKVANMGQKTFEYVDGAERNKVEFNYTQQRQALELMERFDGVALAELHIGLIEYSLKYDPLGLPGELRQIQVDLGEKALADPELLVPSLERIVNNPRLLHLAQVRAQEIINSVTERR